MADKNDNNEIIHLSEGDGETCEADGCGLSAEIRVKGICYCEDCYNEKK